MLLSQERVIKLLYAKTFERSATAPPAAGGGGGAGVSGDASADSSTLWPVGWTGDGGGWVGDGEVPAGMPAGQHRPASAPSTSPRKERNVGLFDGEGVEQILGRT
jgi:hypothetical protein